MYLMDTTHCIKIMSGDTELRAKISNIIDLQMATCLILDFSHSF
jgi:predicted nucleic acid-binding protein